MARNMIPVMQVKHGHAKVAEWLKAAERKGVKPGKPMNAWLAACARNSEAREAGDATAKAESVERSKATVPACKNNPETIATVARDLQRRYPKWPDSDCQGVAARLVARVLTQQQVDSMGFMAQ